MVVQKLFNMSDPDGNATKKGMKDWRLVEGKGQKVKFQKHVLYAQGHDFGSKLPESSCQSTHVGRNDSALKRREFSDGRGEVIQDVVKVSDLIGECI